MHRVRSAVDRLTYANVVATIALFVSLGGASYAALVLPAHSVGARQLRPGAVMPNALSFPIGVKGVTDQAVDDLGKSKPLLDPCPEDFRAVAEEAAFSCPEIAITVS